MIVYRIVNILNGKIYIGKTIHSLDQRWHKHCHNALIEKRKGRFYSAIRKYGSESFIKEIISQHSSVDDMNLAEIEAIKLFDSQNSSIGYNMTSGGDGGHNKGTQKLVEIAKNRKGKTALEIYGEEKSLIKRQKASAKMVETWKNNPREISPDTRDKMRTNQLARLENPEYRLKISNFLRSISKFGAEHPMYGKKHSAEALQKISESSKGRVHSEERKEKMRIKFSGEKNPFYKQLPLDTIIEIMIDKPEITMEELSKKFNTSRQTISKRIKTLLMIENIQRTRYEMGPDTWNTFLLNHLESFILKTNSGNDIS